MHAVHERSACTGTPRASKPAVMGTESLLARALEQLDEIAHFAVELLDVPIVIAQVGADLEVIGQTKRHGNLLRLQSALDAALPLVLPVRPEAAEPEAERLAFGPRFKELLGYAEHEIEDAFKDLKG